MCYAAPGPRCSNHATEKLARATKAYEADPSRKVLYEAMKEAEEEYDTTPAGMKALRATGKPADAMRADIAQQTRAAQLAAYNERKRMDAVEPEEESPEIQRLRADAESDDWETRQDVALHSKTPVDVLTYLAKDEHEEVRASVARDPNTPPEVLTHLAEDWDDSTCFHVRNNPNTPVEVRDAMVNHPNPDVREDIADDEDTPIRVVAGLAKDKNPSVREAAMSALAERSNSELVEALKADFPEVKPDMPREWLMKLLTT